MDKNEKRKLFDCLKKVLEYDSTQAFMEDDNEELIKLIKLIFD